MVSLTMSDPPRPGQQSSSQPRSQPLTPSSATDDSALDLQAVGPDVTLRGLFFLFVRSEAAWSCGLGLISIVSPLFGVGHLYFSQFLLFLPFIFLPLLGIVFGVRAMDGDQKAGGVAGIVLSVIGGIVTILGVVADFLARLPPMF